ncbi:UbiA family prenyltransferase [Hymenobacter norwichensis]|uniref:UbiA family prenyltransferase n=1 Tax=Hymenobacter norwichensis TaxID=223903 RepID=UPI0012F99F2B|nr:UbiA family prenyltransferase [Hymenobacter norwichensis]
MPYPTIATNYHLMPLESPHSSSTAPVADAVQVSWWRRGLDAVLYSSTWLALAALGLTWSTFLFWQVHIPFRPGLMIFTATLFLYNIDSVLPYKHGQPLMLSGRKRWMLEHRRELLALAMVALGVSGTLFFLDGWQHLMLFLGHLAAISMLYSLPVVKVRGQWRALRDLPLLKVFLIAYVWAAVTVWVPALYLDKSLFGPVVGILFLRRFFFILALAFVFDIRDYTKDLHTGTRTFPGLFGVQATKWIALGALVLAGVLLPTGVGATEALVLTLPLLAAAGTIWYAEESRSDYYYALLADGVMVFQFLVVYLVKW